jgi:hypothetical protein
MAATNVLELFTGSAFYVSYHTSGRQPGNESCFEVFVSVESRSSRETNQDSQVIWGMAKVSLPAAKCLGKIAGHLPLFWRLPEFQKFCVTPPSQRKLSTSWFVLSVMQGRLIACRSEVD